MVLLVVCVCLFVCICVCKGIDKGAMGAEFKCPLPVFEIHHIAV